MDEFLNGVKKEVNENVGIDFDGVIHLNSKGFYDGTIYDDPLPGTKEGLESLSKEYTLIIYTCKARQDRPLVNGKTGIELIWGWLKKQGFDQYISEVTNIKPRAKFYIDDKGIRFSNWAQTLSDVDKFE